MITGLSHITVAVSDLERSFEFYSKILGFKPLMKQTKGAYLLAGDLWFCLDLDTAARSSPVRDYTHFAFSIEAKDFGDVSERVRSSGAKIWKDNTSEGQSLYFLDPDGHKLEIHVGNWQTRLDHYKSNPNYRHMKFFEE